MMTQEEALLVLKTGANVFLTGEPGSGKTYTINQYVAWLREHGIEPAITASTGIAATHIGGFTIHSWSGIGIKRDLSEQDVDAIAQNKKVVERVSGTPVLIIDEVSMLSARTLAMVDAVCREVRRTSRPFGGLQVIVVGDFFQLPPVSKRDTTERAASGSLYGSEPEEEQFAFAAPAWQAMNPLICYLSEQHRQEDAAFLELLAALRRGEAGEKERAALRQCYAPHAPDGMTQLYAHNADVDVINARELEKIKAPAETFHMETRGPERLVAALIRGCLSPETLVLKVGARVMFTKNDVRRRYVNGTLGEVVDFESLSHHPIIRTASGRTIIAEPDEWGIHDGSKVLASITQVPLRLAWAMTVHKSQGMSLDAAHMNLADVFEYGQGYVALSRVRTLNGLSLAGLNERAFEVHPEVLNKDAEFRELSDAACKQFRSMPAEERKSMHERFVKACGGSAPKEKGMVSRKETTEEESKAYSVEAIRQKHAKAYRSWSKEEEVELQRRHKAGESPASIAKALSRGPGAIRARLAKLGVV
jgi:hypothetical protein